MADENVEKQNVETDKYCKTLVCKVPFTQLWYVSCYSKRVIDEGLKMTVVLLFCLKYYF